MSRPKAVQFGAGAIGRGFLGQLYSQSGWETVFIEVNPRILKALNDRGGYEIEIAGPGAKTVEVRNVRAVDGRETSAVAEELLEADLAATAVGTSALPAVASCLAEGIARRAAKRPDSFLDVLICENLLSAAAHVRGLLVKSLASARHERTPREALTYLAERVGLVETVVSRMIPVPDPEAPDPLSLAAEAYDVLPVDELAFRGGVPAIKGLLPTKNFRAFEERKLYAHNCGHALAAYFGSVAGHSYIWEVMEDPPLAALVEEGLWEAGEALCRRHGFTHEEHDAHLRDLLERFGNRALGDTVARVGRDPLRKLGPEDRLVGAARLAGSYGLVPSVLAAGVAAALCFLSSGGARGDPSAARVSELMRSGGAERVLREVCRLEPGTTLWRLVMEARERLEREGAAWLSKEGGGRK